jgi:hypothetical protein
MLSIRLRKKKNIESLESRNDDNFNRITLPVLITGEKKIMFLLLIMKI